MPPQARPDRSHVERSIENAAKSQLLLFYSCMDTFVFILKVLLLSLGLSWCIKYIGPSLAIAPTRFNVLIAILLPSLVILLLLIGQRWQQTTQSKD